MKVGDVVRVKHTRRIGRIAKFDFGMVYVTFKFGFGDWYFEQQLEELEEWQLV